MPNEKSPGGQRTKEYLGDTVGDQHFKSEYKRRYNGSPESGDENVKVVPPLAQYQGKFAGISTFKQPLVNLVASGQQPGAKILPMYQTNSAKQYINATRTSRHQAREPIPQLYENAPINSVNKSRFVDKFKNFSSNLDKTLESELQQESSSNLAQHRNITIPPSANGTGSEGERSIERFQNN